MNALLSLLIKEVVKLICKHCGKETSTVICEHCGINVVWYNKYGIQHDIENQDELAQYDIFIPDEDVSIEEVVTEVFNTNNL